MAAQQPARTSPELRARLHSARANVGITPRPGALPEVAVVVLAAIFGCDADPKGGANFLDLTNPAHGLKFCKSSHCGVSLMNVFR